MSDLIRETTLSEFEVTITWTLAKAVVEANVKSNNRDRQLAKREPVEIQAHGFGGELGFCKLHNLYPMCFAIGEWSHYDCIRHDGVTVNVKTMSYDTAKTKILVPAHQRYQNPHPDVYACMIGVLPNFRFVGYVTPTEIFRDENKCDMGRGPSYGLLVPYLWFFGGE